jgi:hypothetical protein
MYAGISVPTSGLIRLNTAQGEPVKESWLAMAAAKEKPRVQRLEHHLGIQGHVCDARCIHPESLRMEIP